MKRQLKKTTLSIAVAQAALICGGAAFAQTTTEKTEPELQTIVVSGQRAAMQTASKLKQHSEDIIDGVVAEEAGKLPEKSITEVLQRVVGVTIDRNRSRENPEQFSVEGSGISIRGLSWGSSTLNGRESFSAGWPGRELSWGDIPPELMSAVIVHKNPPAELIEGGVSGQVDLRTALPFDYKDQKLALSVYGNYTELGRKKSPAVSGLYSKRWNTSSGQWGALIDLSYNKSNTRNDTVQMDAYFPRTLDGQTVHVPKSASWRTNTGEMERGGIYAALQWKKSGAESALTYFHSGYKESSTEHALFTGVEDAYKSQLVDPVFDANGVLQSATYTYPIGGKGANNFAAGGLGFTSDSGYSTKRSHTGELAWNTKWTINDRWSLQNDLQWVHSANKSAGYLMALGTFVPSMNIDATGTPARVTFDQTARDFLADPANYYLNNIMPSMNKADADMYAWKLDAKYKFDHPVMRDVRFGVRVTDRKANRIEASGKGWHSLAEPWNVKTTSRPGQLPNSTDMESWQRRGNFGYFSDPRYASMVPTDAYNFENFFAGKIGVPATLVVPNLDFTKRAESYAAVQPILRMGCEDGNRLYGTNHDCSEPGRDWSPLVYDGNPAKTSRQEEQTQAAYVSTRFGFNDLRFPIEGNAGVRVVHTKTTAHGHTVFKPTYGTPPNPEIPLFGEINDPIDVEHSYVNVLPSMNLKMELTDNLQTRFAFAQSMYRPGFGQLSEYIELEQKIVAGEQGQAVGNIVYKGQAKGNANLKPIRANSFDVTLEWYPGHGSSLTAGIFHKKVRDIILPSAFAKSYTSLAGNTQNFLITGPDNAANGSVSGLEVAGQTYLNNVPALQKILPEWAKGFGISANYTYIKSKQKLHHPFDLKYCPAAGSFNNSSLSMYGCDTNGLPFSEMPIMYLSKNAYNVTFLYDKGPLSARLAYSWRGRFLQGVTVNGTQGEDATSADPARRNVATGAAPHDVAWGLPTWQEAMGQLDLGVDYRYTDRVSFSFAASNLTDTIVKQTQQQHIGNMPRAWFNPGRSYRLAMRYSY